MAAPVIKEEEQGNFIRQWIDKDLADGKIKDNYIITRFPPEPNGFLHLGHAKSICLNFGLTQIYKGHTHLRFDDTNPAKEEMRYIESIMEDVKWLGFDWGEHLYYASDYFEQLYQMAESLIQSGLAYVDEQTEEELRKNRGNLKTPGVNSPFRDRSVETNLELFRQMKAGKYPDGSMILRAKIDMAHGNMNMRDPPIYRIKHCEHPRTGDQWCIYPIYDFAHGQSDSIEKITHSICTMEFYDHRLLYEWFQEKLNITRTQQIEFSRLNTTHTVMSKRKLLALVKEKFVNDWDDPRMPTISGMRRRGFPASALREFCERVGITRRAQVIPLSLLELCVRESLTDVPRRFAVINPLKVVLTNWDDESRVETLEAANHPEKPELGTRQIVFSKNLYIDASDFMENPDKNFFRLAPGKEVRLRYGYWIKCNEVVKNEKNEILELLCTYDPTTRNGNPPSDGRKVKGTLHWLSDMNSSPVEFRLYDRLFTVPNPEGDLSTAIAGTTGTDAPTTTPLEETISWRDFINPKSLVVSQGYLEKLTVASMKVLDVFQFERKGFFCVDKDSVLEKPVLNLTVDLQDSYAAATGADVAKEKEKEAAKIAREKAAAERQKVKDARHKKQVEKESNVSAEKKVDK